MNLFAFSMEEAAAIAASRGTPCFAYRLDIAERRYRELRAALPARVRLAYAVKSNPHPALLARFASIGAYFDAASGGELARLGAAGVSGGHILLGGPGKAQDEIELALAMGARIQADGPEDLERVEKALSHASSHGGAIGDAETPLPVSIRVHPGSEAVFSEGTRIIGGSSPSAFGVDEEALDAFLDDARRFSKLRVAGLQVFAASNERDAGRLLANHRAAFAIGRRMQRKLGRPLDLVDLGGGLGIPYAEAETELDIAQLGRGLAALLAENAWFEGEIVLEPGRWLSGTCGVYLARVLRTKESRGVRFAVLEGGANHLLRPLLTGQPFPAAVPGKDGEKISQVLAGPLCTSLDRLGEVSVPRLAAGDLVMLGQAGAYGYTEAMGDFLSHPRPGEFWYEGSPL